MPADLTPLERAHPVILPCLPYLLCKCCHGHRWKLGLPWWSFNVREVECPECGWQVESVQFMGEYQC